MNFTIGGLSYTAADYNRTTQTIKLGCDMEEVNKTLSDALPSYHQFSCIEEYFEKCAEPLLTHEYFHHIIGELEGRATSRKFDNIDSDHEITIGVVIEP